MIECSTPSTLEMLGPVVMPLRDVSGRVGDFIFYYTEFNNRRYVIVFRGEPRDGISLRIESACVFGHIFGSVKCDCHFQLDKAIEQFNAEGNGMVIYGLDDDGRGTSVKMHMLFYVLRQQKKMETEELYRHLGIDKDCRDYVHVIEILRHFGIKRVRLLTNNINRIEFLRSNGITVDRQPIEAEVQQYNADLLLDEKANLRYDVSYMDHEHWADLLKKAYPDSDGFLIVKGHKEVIGKGHKKEIGKTLEELGAKQGYLVAYFNHLPVDDVLAKLNEKFDKIVFVGIDVSGLQIAHECLV